VSIALGNVLCQRPIELTHSSGLHPYPQQIILSNLTRRTAHFITMLSHHTGHNLKPYLNALSNTSQHRRDVESYSPRVILILLLETHHNNSNLSRACSPILVGKPCCLPRVG
jgi:hypothetical protein